MKFHLRVLSLDNLLFETKPPNLHLLNFLKSQKTDIEDIEIGKHFSASVFKVIFQEMTNLKTVSIRGEYIPLEIKDLSIPNTSVKKLVVRGQIKDRSHSFKAIINMLPNLKIVKFLDSIYGCCNETLKYMADNLIKLEELYLCRCNNRNFSAVKFSNLKTLHLEWPDEIEVNNLLFSLSVTH